jgi:RHS repeat-associated protein
VTKAVWSSPGATGGGTTAVTFPVYDGHGNMVATLSRSGNSYALVSQRSYDAWGLVRQGATTGDPTGRYCGNLGHKQDDESGLIYMRARYYEPTSGRFISQDPSMDGANWFTYCGNDPCNYVDETGKSAQQPDGLSMAFRNALLLWLVASGVAAILAGLVLVAIGLAALPENAPLGVLLIAIGALGVLAGATKTFFAGDISDAIGDRVDRLRSQGGFAPMGCLTALGEVGLMLVGLGMGLQEGDADAWVWGF